jgi:hypothetical protein
MGTSEIVSTVHMPGEFVPEVLNPDPWYRPGVGRLATGSRLMESTLVGSLASGTAIATAAYPSPYRSALVQYVGYSPAGGALSTDSFDWLRGAPARHAPGAHPGLQHTNLKTLTLSPVTFVGSRPPGRLRVVVGDQQLADAQFLVTLSQSSAELLHRAAELLRLRNDWDTQGASAIGPIHLVRMLRFLDDQLFEQLPTPSIVPMSDGGVQIEWHRGGLDVEVTFGADEVDSLYCLELASDEEWEGDPYEGFRVLRLRERLGPTSAVA